MHTTRRILLGAQLPPPRSYALDLEYVKFNGTSYVRSLALVPFARAELPSPRPSHESEVHVRAGSPDGSRVQLPPHTLTELGGTPTVLELNPREVMRVAEPLPCGHLLLPKIQKALVQGAALEELRAPLEAEARGAMASFLGLRRALRKEGKRATREKNDLGALAALRHGESSGGDIDAAADFVDEANTFSFLESESASALPAADPATEAEKLVVRELQIRLSTVQLFKGLDPFGIPNIHRFNREALELLYAAPVESPDFVAASQHICGLRAYSKGRQGYKSLAHLSRHHPHFLQALLRRSFERPSAWYSWLADCALSVEANLIEVRNAHRDDTRVSAWRHVGRSTGDTAVDADRVQTASAPVPASSSLNFQESLTMQDLAKQINLLWSGLVHAPASPYSGSEGASMCSRAKVYVYGSSDASVLRRTLGLAFTGAPLQCPRSERGLRAGSRFPGRKQLRDAAAAAHAAALSSAHQTPPRPLRPLSPPLEAVIVDATRHPLFTAAGFAPSPKQPPSLMTALEKAANSDATAAELLSAPQWHDPLWDAQALACVCACAGMVRVPVEREKDRKTQHT
ncbi:conserved hypothetical protein [Leishmania major strain Friedlin]|uniref:Uncharacterized protein n=1 Tax=Leishmania major TaxID=5664 RepID=Q4Q4R5_LEIMA|nr:conserved hypothetical protein [Leishmania major strain Friedlin]CAG9580507.1 hypothetical_protein_-_conserved [Leishmania major strain Friedlin]CAJ08888.1 conserved hypothetical protein [Leishmania major strain Friedlin]|eukprot:XP_001685683.1 conserved hypothetical protein [Leishmania major strain Friedlin]